MEGITLDQYVREHPEVSICRVAGTYYAWKPAVDELSGEEAHAQTAGELLTKLTKPVKRAS